MKTTQPVVMLLLVTRKEKQKTKSLIPWHKGRAQVPDCLDGKNHVDLFAIAQRQLYGLLEQGDRLRRGVAVSTAISSKREKLIGCEGNVGSATEVTESICESRKIILISARNPSVACPVFAISTVTVGGAIGRKRRSNST